MKESSSILSTSPGKKQINLENHRKMTKAIEAIKKKNPANNIKTLKQRKVIKVVSAIN